MATNTNNNGSNNVSINFDAVADYVRRNWSNYLDRHADPVTTIAKRFGVAEHVARSAFDMVRFESRIGALAYRPSISERLRDGDTLVVV